MSIIASHPEVITIETAALDTSFWTAGHRADVLPYMFSVFELNVPPAVRDEILAADILYPRRRYGYAELYRVLEGCGLLPVEEPATPLARYGRGEAKAIRLAQERGWWLLINDNRPLAFARSQGVHTLSVPGFILELYKTDVISLVSAEQKLTRIAPMTSSDVLEPIRREVDRLARSRRER